MSKHRSNANELYFTSRYTNELPLLTNHQQDSIEATVKSGSSSSIDMVSKWLHFKAQYVAEVCKALADILAALSQSSPWWHIIRSPDGEKKTSIN